MMDRFLNIDWNPPLEDIIDNTFINEGRLEKESVMHRIMTGNFTDPFKNVEEDYKHVKTDLIKNLDPVLKEESNEGDVATTEMEKGCHSKQAKRSYVPGIVKPIFKFPKKSQLNKEQQAMCLRVLLRFSESDKPKLTSAEREELQNYMDLQQIISQEQDEFLEFAKSKWQERSFKIMCEDYINACWKLKLEYIHKLPRYYAEVTNVPFLANKSIEIQFLSVCLQVGELPRIILPTFTGPYMLRINSEQLRKRFPPSRNISHEASTSFKLPVSEDPNCQKLAESNNVDLVISSSGLNCLVNNLGPNYSNSWILPVVIKRHNDRNIIYIDKQAPPTASTIPEKNTWVYKYILKYFLGGVKDTVCKSTEAYSDNVFGDVNSEELLKLEEQYENVNKSLNLLEKNEKAEETTKQSMKSDLNSLEEIETCNEYSHTLPESSIGNPSNGQVGTKNRNFDTDGDNVSYKLFRIAPQLSEQNELMKNVSKEYKILVRTKTGGFEILENGLQRQLLIAPKLEHQVDFGAEAVTLEESLKQWISLVFRPHTFLARVRINAKTSEILQTERRTVISLNNEIKRLHNLKVEDSLTILHNVIQSLTNLTPGRYVMRHTIRNGAFAVVFKEVEGPGKNIFDIHTAYGENYHTLLNSSWIPLDKTIATPMLRCFERMPAMFFPSNDKKFPTNKKRTKAKKSTAGTVRRSLRNKKKK